MTMYILNTKEKYFELDGKKVLISSSDKIILDSTKLPVKFKIYQEDKLKNTFDYHDIPSELAQDLIFLLHLRPHFISSGFVKRIIK